MANNLCDLKFQVGSVPFRLTTKSTEQVGSGQNGQTRFCRGSVERVSDPSGNESRRFFLGAHHCQIKLHAADLLLTDEIERVAISLLTVLIVLFFYSTLFPFSPSTSQLQQPPEHLVGKVGTRSLSVDQSRILSNARCCWREIECLC
jgi:hypothetical protein